MNIKCNLIIFSFIFNLNLLPIDKTLFEQQSLIENIHSDTFDELQAKLPKLSSKQLETFVEKNIMKKIKTISNLIHKLKDESTKQKDKTKKDELKYTIEELRNTLNSLKELQFSLEKAVKEEMERRIKEKQNETSCIIL